MQLGPLPVHLADVFLILPVGQLLPFRGSRPAAGNPGRHLSVDKQTQRLKLRQNHIGVSAHNDTVSPLCQLLHQLCLPGQQISGELRRPQLCGKGVADGDGKTLHPCPPLQHPVQVLLIERSLLRQKGQNFPVIVRVTQMLRQALSQLPASTAKLSAHCNQIHPLYLLKNEPDKKTGIPPAILSGS